MTGTRHQGEQGLKLGDSEQQMAIAKQAAVLYLELLFSLDTAYVYVPSEPHSCCSLHLASRHRRLQPAMCIGTHALPFSLAMLQHDLLTHICRLQLSVGA